MNINQLESYNLADAVKFHDNLNPLLWDRRENLHPEIRDQLMAIASDFSEFLGVKDLDLKDITISGSNAAYSYTPHSDIDLHLIVDLSDVEHEDVYRELFTAKKSIYNKENTITIKGIPVEVYVQDATQDHHSQGIYSILNTEWIQIPRRIQADIDDISVRSKYEDLSKRIKKVIKSNDLEQMNQLMDKIRQMRGIGLAEKGEFGPENLAFKLLRNTGDLKKLQTARQTAKDQELSLKERVRNSTKYGYGTDYIEEVGMTPDGTNPTTSEFTNETQLDEVELTPDGTNPTTAQFTNETRGDDKSTIKNFMEFCADQLGIDKDISLRIRQDPQWSVRNKTFGRYNDGTNELEVGIGGRHIMDVLRTVAHELVHQKQNQHAQVPADAGEDGSKYENEANAQAGVLMRQYGKLHPELFANSSSVPTDIAEGKEQITWVKPNFEFEWHEVEEQSKMKQVPPEVRQYYKKHFPTKDAWLKAVQNGKAVVIQPDHTFEIRNAPHDKKSLLQVLAPTSHEGAVGPAKKKRVNALFAKGGPIEMPIVLKTSNGLWLIGGKTRLGTANYIKGIPAKVWMIDGNQGVAEGLNEASGYIPTTAEAHDPRFEMALSVDIHPGSLGKAANSFLLNTDSQGHPQELRPDGLVQRMTEELALFKKKTSRLTENKLKFSRDKLDSLLNDLCEKVTTGQEEAPDFYGMVAAAVIDPKGRLATGINYLYGNQRIHAERAAIDNYEKKYGKLPSDCIIVTTLSPCNQDTGDIKEVTCTEVLNDKQIKIAYCGYMDPTQHRENNDFTILVTKNEKLNQMCKELADTFLKNKLDENTQHRHTEVFKYEYNGWVIYQNDHAAIRAATRQIGPIMQNNLLEATSNIHSLADKIPVGGDFWVQDIKTNSSLYFKRLDIPSEPQALRWETAVKDVPRASSKTPVFKVNAYTQPESPGDIAFMKKLKFAARFTGVDALAANLTQRAQKHKSDPDQIISDPEKQDSDRYNRAFKQAAQVKKTGVAEVKGIGINVYEEEEDNFEQLPSVNQAKNLLPMILAKVQKEYDDWDQSDVDTYAGGGICHILAEAICGILSNNGIECTTVSCSYEQHVYVAGKFDEGIYTIDIPYHIYETGGGFSWKKIPNITFDASDVIFYKSSGDPADWENYIADY